MQHTTYEAFGVNFIRHAVTPERIAHSMNNLTDDAIQVGPMAAGPGGVAVVTATGRVGKISVIREDFDELVRFRAVLPIDLDLEVKLGPVPNRYNGRVEVPLALTVQAAEPLLIVIEIEPVLGRAVVVDLEPAHMGAELLQKVGNLDAEVQVEVAKVVNKRLESEDAMKARIIDIGHLVESSTELD